MDYNLPIGKQRDILKDIKYPFNVKFNDTREGGGSFQIFPIKMEMDSFVGIAKKDISLAKRIYNGDIIKIVKKEESDWKPTIRDGKQIGKSRTSWYVTDDGYALGTNVLSYLFFVPQEESKKSVAKTTSNNSLEQDLNNSDLGKTARKVQIGFSVIAWGVFGILAYKFWNKSTTWKVMLSVFGAYNLYNTYKTFKKPALKVSGGSDSNTGTTTGITPVPVPANKSQKIDLIVNSMSDPEQKGMDDFNRKFMNTLTDAELNTWVKLSKALKDTSLKAGDKEQVYKILLTKYNVSQKEFDDSMKKWGEALMGGFEQGLQEGLVNASQQVFEEGFTNQNQSSFSNFESSLNLDL
jgi:hypothetical protein